MRLDCKMQSDDLNLFLADMVMFFQLFDVKVIQCLAAGHLGLCSKLRFSPNLKTV